jgi:iron(II)-dependent oxidoreductase
MGCVTESEAQSVCSKLGKHLPTQDEWEFAAVGRHRSHYTHDSQGHELTAQMMRAHFGTASIHVVGSDPLDVSPFGVRDLGGNMAEWTSDRVGNNYVVRGGSFLHPEFDLFQASRLAAPLSEEPDIGFRCAARPI